MRPGPCKHVGSTPAEHPDLIFGVFSWGAYEYFRLRRRAGLVASKLRVIAEKMDCDELLDQLLKRRLS